MIVLAGNAQESEHRLKDCSAFIDSGKPRLVVRVSKMCNYDSGKTGTRCDWVFLNPNPMYWTFPPGRRHWNVLAGASKIIVTYPPPRKPERRALHSSVLAKGRIPVSAPAPFSGISAGGGVPGRDGPAGLTTFGFALWVLSRRFPQEQIALHGCITSQDALAPCPLVSLAQWRWRVCPVCQSVPERPDFQAGRWRIML